MQATVINQCTAMRSAENSCRQLSAVSELHLGSLIFEGTVLRINERHADFLKGSLKKFLMS